MSMNGIHSSTRPMEQVEVKRGDLFLKADHARLNTATKDLAAWGNVLLREGEDVVECERLEVNLDTRLGKIYQAKLFLKDQNFHITGQEAEKVGGEPLSGSRWLFHHLRCDTPSVEIYGERIGGYREGIWDCKRAGLLS